MSSQFEGPNPEQTNLQQFAEQIYELWVSYEEEEKNIYAGFIEDFNNLMKDFGEVRNELEEFGSHSHMVESHLGEVEDYLRKKQSIFSQQLFASQSSQASENHSQ